MYVNLSPTMSYSHLYNPGGKLTYIRGCITVHIRKGIFNCIRESFISLVWKYKRASVRTSVRDVFIHRCNLIRM